MPAQSPTLSPTLSAMVAGLRGSSSGMPASTLPTRSPPTSAPLVKMPPPRRAKIEISEAPKPSATSASIDDAARPARSRATGSGWRSRRRRRAAPRPATSMPVTAPALKATSRPAGQRLRARPAAVRTLARTETFMPMKPAAPDSTAPIRKPIADLPCRGRRPASDEDHDADDGDGRVLALEIGLRAFLDRGGDLLHARIAGVGLHDRWSPRRRRRSTALRRAQSPIMLS